MRYARPILTLACLALAAAPSRGGSSATLIVNASVLDGSGAPARHVDVRIDGGRIVAVGQLSPASGDAIVDAGGLTLAPGFIDTHSHHDHGLLDHRDALAAVSQGITTIVAGQDGSSNFPLADFFGRLEAQPAAVNVASYVGHGTIRARVLGDDFSRPSTSGELDRMRGLVHEEMASGALGLSTGLEYDPGIFATPDEVLDLARAAAAEGGRYISHIRSEDRDFWQALDEVIAIGRTTGMPVQVSHLKLAMRSLWGQGDKLIDTLDRARKAGVQITADVYPYTMWHSSLTVLYPRRNFADRAETNFILTQVAAPEDLVIGDFALEPSYVGRTVGEIATLRHSDAASTLMALIAESQAARADESVVARGMDERDIAAILRWPHANICTDGTLDGAHPRGFGAFPRVLGHYVRDRHVLTLEEAVRRMTGLAADHVGIPDRGRIVPGDWADLVLFDPRTIADRATMEDPHAVSDGVRTVWVNGEVVFRDGKTTGAFPGRVLRRTQGAATATAASSGGSTAPPSDPPAERIDAFIRQEMARQHIPGLAVAIVQKGRISARGYGYANVEHMVPVTDATMFQSGSVGKMFTAAAVMLQVEDGKLALADPITKFFPDAPASWKAITVRHLLTHTSGIPDYTTSGFDYRRDYTEDELARLAYQQPLEFAPGTRWNYSNTGYALLGFIVRKVSGRFYGDVLAERVFKPLGMPTARIISESDIVPNRAAGYEWTDGRLTNQEWVSPTLNTTADGSLYLSLRDMVAWDAAVKRRALLRSSSWDEILTPVRLASGKTYPYGMGWDIAVRAGQPLFEHGGAWQGFRSQISRFVGDDLDIVVLANLAQADPGRVVDGLAALFDPALAVPAPTPMADTEPSVTARVRTLVDGIRARSLKPVDFPYLRGGFFPDGAATYARALDKLGALQRLTLLSRTELGDDREYLYEASFAGGSRFVRIAFAPDGSVSSFGLTERP